MSELPANIDAILASIRSRMNEDPAAPEPAAPPVEPDAPPLPISVAELGEVAIAPAGTGTTLDDLVRAMLEPLLQKWLDANMPEIVEKMAQAEIKRLTGRD